MSKKSYWHTIFIDVIQGRNVYFSRTIMSDDKYFPLQRFILKYGKSAILLNAYKISEKDYKFYRTLGDYKIEGKKNETIL